MNQIKLNFLESDLYDFASGDLQWPMQPEATNPASIETFSKEYTDRLVPELAKVGFKRKQPAYILPVSVLFFEADCY